MKTSHRGVVKVGARSSGSGRQAGLKTGGGRRAKGGNVRRLDGGDPEAAGDPEAVEDNLKANGGDSDSANTSDPEGDSEQEDDIDAPQPSASQKKSAGQPEFDPAEALQAQQIGRKKIAEKRTDNEAKQWRDGYFRGVVTFQQLRRAGYHPQPPFSSLYPYGGILDAVGPDLLHQVTKCFINYLFNC